MPKITPVAYVNFGGPRTRLTRKGDKPLYGREGYDDYSLCRSAAYPCGVVETILPRLPEADLGAHVVTPRFGYFHHGIYVGSGNVVHYAGFGTALRRGAVEEVSIAHFTRNRPAWVIPTEAAFNGHEVVDRARSRLGEDCYRLWTNNCEHFCEWCLRGEHRSFQVERWMDRIKAALGARC